MSNFDAVNARRKEEAVARRTPRVEILSEPLDKAIQERRDFREGNVEAWEAPDPMKGLVAQYVAPGMRPRAPGMRCTLQGQQMHGDPYADDNEKPPRPDR